MKAVQGVMKFLLKRNLMGPAGKVLMVIITTGRKTGKHFSTPIGYVRDGSTILTFTMGATSNWFKNVLKNPEATLIIKGKPVSARGMPVDMSNDREVLRVLEVYKRERPQDIKRFFGVSPEGTPEQLLKARERVSFLRFYPHA